MNTWNDGNIQTHRSEIRKLQVEIEEQKHNINILSDVAMTARLERDRLHEALELIPAELMLEAGPPYTLNFSEETLRQIKEAIDKKGR